LPAGVAFGLTANVLKPAANKSGKDHWPEAFPMAQLALLDPLD
jgi:hypothetical protein